MNSFVVGQFYRRRALHEEYGGSYQSGMCPSAKYPIIFLFTGKSGEQHGYKDGWTDDGLFFYTGEGQSGDMQFTKGNKALRDHIQNEKDVHLFEAGDDAYVRYLGQFVCTGHHSEHDPVKNRQRIVFELSPVEEFEAGKDSDEVEASTALYSSSLQELRSRALGAATEGVTPKERKTLVRARSLAIRRYAVERSGGICESCLAPAPFKAKSGRPFLEVHHLHRLTDGGPDHPSSVAAVCPNCHRRAHYGVDSEQFNAKLLAAVKEKEREAL